MRKSHLAQAVRNGDLAVVHVSRQNQVERPWFKPIENLREVTEQDPEIGRTRERVRVEPRSMAKERARVHACDPDGLPTYLEHDALILEQVRRLEITQVRLPGHR